MKKLTDRFTFFLIPVLALMMLTIMSGCGIDSILGGDKEKTVKIGESFTAGDLEGKATSVNDNYSIGEDYGIQSLKPKEGNKFILVNFSFKNTGDSDEYVDVYDFSCYADDASCEQHYYNGDYAKDSKLSPGKTVSFGVIFEVPKNSKKIELEFEPDTITENKVIIKIK